jgi:predicted Fe-Mo cluster-binding NifX family protein
MLVFLQQKRETASSIRSGPSFSPDHGKWRHMPPRDLKGTVSDHLGQAPYFALVELRAEDGALLREEIVANPHQALDKQKGLEVARMLVDRGVDVLLVRENLEGKGPSYVLADAGVETRITQAGSLEEILRDLEPEGDQPAVPS